MGLTSPFECGEASPGSSASACPQRRHLAAARRPAWCYPEAGEHAGCPGILLAAAVRGPRSARRHPRAAPTRQSLRGITRFNGPTSVCQKAASGESEMRTYTVQPGSAATVEERFGQALPARAKREFADIGRPAFELLRLGADAGPLQKNIRISAGLGVFSTWRELSVLTSYIFLMIPSL